MGSTKALEVQGLACKTMAPFSCGQIDEAVSDQTVKVMAIKSRSCPSVRHDQKKLLSEIHQRVGLHAQTPPLQTMVAPIIPEWHLEANVFNQRLCKCNWNLWSFAEKYLQHCGASKVCLWGITKQETGKSTKGVVQSVVTVFFSLLSKDSLSCCAVCLSGIRTILVFGSRKKVLFKFEFCRIFEILFDICQPVKFPTMFVHFFLNLLLQKGSSCLVLTCNQTACLTHVMPKWGWQLGRSLWGWWARDRMDNLNQWGLNLSFMFFMIRWMSLDQRPEHPMQKWIFSLSVCLVLDSSSACQGNGCDFLIVLQSFSQSWGLLGDEKHVLQSPEVLSADHVHPVAGFCLCPWLLPVQTSLQLQKSHDQLFWPKLVATTTKKVTVCFCDLQTTFPVCFFTTILVATTTEKEVIFSSSKHLAFVLQWPSHFQAIANQAWPFWSHSDHFFLVIASKQTWFSQTCHELLMFCSVSLSVCQFVMVQGFGRQSVGQGLGQVCTFWHAWMERAQMTSKRTRIWKITKF